MSGVIAIGRHAGPFLPQPTHVVHVDADAAADRLTLHDVLLEQLTMQGSRSPKGPLEPLLVVYPAHLDPGLGRALRTLSAALDHPPLLWHATALPPLAADVLVTLAGALVEPLGGAPGVAAIIGLLERQLLHWTWVPSVAKVERPAPSLWQHAQSSLPSSSWLISSWPEPTITRLGAEVPEVPRPGQPVGLAVADVDGDRSWVGPLAERLPGVRPVEVDAPVDLASTYGCRQATQVVLYPSSVDALASVLRGRLDPGCCSWCRRDVGTLVCPWCRLPRTGLTRVEDRSTGTDDQSLAVLGTTQEIAGP